MYGNKKQRFEIEILQHMAWLVWLESRTILKINFVNLSVARIEEADNRNNKIFAISYVDQTMFLIADQFNCKLYSCSTTNYFIE